MRPQTPPCPAPDYLDDIPKILRTELVPRDSNQNTNRSSLLNTITNVSINSSLPKDISALEKLYAPLPKYIFDCKVISFQHRAALVHWISDICCQLDYKRETFYYAVSSLDRYLSKKLDENPKRSLLAIGLSCLFLAAKMEEVVPPKIAQFLYRAKDMTASLICGIEIDIIKAVDFHLTPPTLSMFCNFILMKWDEFASNSALDRSTFKNGVPKFRGMTFNNYRRYRRLFQLLDAAVLEVQSLQYNPRALASSFFYLQLGVEVEEFDSDRIGAEFPTTSQFILSRSSFNLIMEQFFLSNLSVKLVELLPTI